MPATCQTDSSSGSTRSPELQTAGGPSGAHRRAFQLPVCSGRYHMLSCRAGRALNPARARMPVNQAEGSAVMVLPYTHKPRAQYCGCMRLRTVWVAKPDPCQLASPPLIMGPRSPAPRAQYSAVMCRAAGDIANCRWHSKHTPCTDVHGCAGPLVITSRFGDEATLPRGAGGHCRTGVTGAAVEYKHIKCNMKPGGRANAPTSQLSCMCNKANTPVVQGKEAVVSCE